VKCGVGKFKEVGRYVFGEDKLHGFVVGMVTKKIENSYNVFSYKVTGDKIIRKSRDFDKIIPTSDTFTNTESITNNIKHGTISYQKDMIVPNSPSIGQSYGTCTCPNNSVYLVGMFLEPNQDISLEENEVAGLVTHQATCTCPDGQVFKIGYFENSNDGNQEVLPINRHCINGMFSLSSLIADSSNTMAYRNYITCGGNPLDVFLACEGGTPGIPMDDNQNTVKVGKTLENYIKYRKSYQAPALNKIP